MALLANGTLTVEQVGVAKQAASLPSASKFDSTSRSDASKKNVAEGTFAERAEDTVNIATGDARELEVTENETNNTTGEPEGALGFSNTDVVESAREAERERIGKITEEINERLNNELTLRFGEDEETGVGFFQLVEKETGDVVRQVPPESILEFMKNFQGFSGFLFSQQA
jgi:flagellar protein FlaG